MTRIQGQLFATSAPHGITAALVSPKKSPYLAIYDADGTQISSIVVDAGFAPSCRSMSFYRPPLPHPGPYPALIVLHDDSTLHIYSATDPDYHASVQHHTKPPLRFSFVLLVSDTEALAVSDFGLRATIHDFVASTELVLLRPKPGRGSIAIRPRTGHVAVLTRTANDGAGQSGPGARDHVVVLTPGAAGMDTRPGAEPVAESSQMEASFDVESVDAQGLRWSPSGRWLAVWEAAALGQAAWVYTADGNLFKTWHGAAAEESDYEGAIGLGVKCIGWAGGGEAEEVLLLGLGDGTVVGLGGQTLSPRFTLSFPSRISLSSAPLYQETISGSSRSYTEATQQPAVAPGPSAPPKQSATPAPSGITHLAASPSGALVASVGSSTPTTVWIHELFGGKVATRAVLVHHAPVRTLFWNPCVAGRLLVHCGALGSDDADRQDAGVWVHVWDGEEGPVVLCADGMSAGAKVAAAWAGEASVLVSGGADAGAVLLSLGGDGGASRNVVITGEGPEDAFDEQDDTFAFRRTAR